MKKTILLLCNLWLALGLQAQTFSDDFESYTAGSKLGPQSTAWTTWSGTDGGTDDVNVVTTDNHTTGGTKSLYFTSTSASGGPSDVVLPFGGTQLKTGRFSFTAWFKVPTGKTAYFNFQANVAVGQIWALDCNMNADGTITFGNTTSGLLLSGTYPQEAWFQLTIDVNMNTSVWDPKINGTSLGRFSNPNNIASIDIYPSSAQAEFWVDDVSYTVTPYVLPQVNAAANGITVSNGLVGQTRNASVTIRNMGKDKIKSFDVLVIDNTGNADTMHVTGVLINSLARYTVADSTLFTLENGVNTFTAIISNVNVPGPDGDITDDTASLTITPVKPAPGKRVVLEEGTGTWCQWCPRGAVFMDQMAEKYQGYVASIAVHNFDPMTVESYDSEIGFLAYPSAHVDRNGVDFDPSEIESPFLNKIAEGPAVSILNGAAFNSFTRELKVSLTTTVLQDIIGDFRIAAVITEDSVRGTSSDYSQVNAYAGNAAGPMGGFEFLPNPVPAAQMFYNHVARAITPSYVGFPYTPGGSADSGQVYNHIIHYVIPADWDINQLHIIGLVMDDLGAINNASSTTLAEAMANGLDSIPAVEINTGNHEITQADASIRLYPNPASDRAMLSLNVAHESTVQVALYGMDGMVIARKDYGKLSGGILLPIEVQHLPSGLYFVNVIIGGNTRVMKLVKP